MEIFRQIYQAIAAVPAWVPLILCPALIVAAAVLLALFGGRRAYPVLAGVVGAAGIAVMSATATVGETVFYAALYAFVACLAGMLHLLPKRVKKVRRTSRDERIYQRFRAELETRPSPPPHRSPRPPKSVALKRRPPRRLHRSCPMR